MNNFIKLSNYGTFLSGRSLPVEILAAEKIDSAFPKITLDFKEIPAANQSFLSQLFIELETRGFKCDDIQIINADTHQLKSRIDQQLAIVFSRLGSVSEK